jgi:MFS family permease
MYSETRHGGVIDDAGRVQKLTGLQIFVLVMCVFINALDGYDVLAIAFSAPALSREWSLSPTELGSLFSAGLVGMAVGALFLSPLADTFGRRRAVLGALVILCVGMLASALASSALQLWFLRFLTGLGIGAMLSTINTLLAEWAPPRYRTLFIGLMSLGYPLGAAAGALIAQHLLAIYTWHAIYLLGLGLPAGIA